MGTDHESEPPISTFRGEIQKCNDNLITAPIDRLLLNDEEKTTTRRMDGWTVVRGACQ